MILSENPRIGECVTGGSIGALQQPDRVDAADPVAQEPDSGLVEDRADRGGHCRQRGRRSSERVTDDGTTTVAPHQRSGIERPEVECCHVELAMHLGVGSECHLEAAVEREPVDVIAPHPTTDAVARLEHLHRHACLVQRNGA